MIAAARAPLSAGFPPIAGAEARVLILGSLPGRRSLQMRQYYAQPQNAFWRIMAELYGAGPSLPYETRVARLIARGIAVWDVLAAGERPGSLDSAIVRSSMVVNEFGPFFDQHPELRLIAFNGATAAQLYARRVLPTLAPTFAARATRLLPSTSPANASLRFDVKLARWSAALAP